MKKIFPAITCLVLMACSSSVQNKQTVKNGDVDIAYTQSGKGDTAIVFVHGWAINKEYWQKQISYFSNRYTVVTIDLGGHGQSGRNRNSWAVDDFAGDVAAVVDSLHLNKVVLVGHSMGGDIIVAAANKMPSKVIGFIGIDNFKNISPAVTAEQRLQVDMFMQAIRKNYKQTAFLFSQATLFPKNYTDTASVNRVLRDVTNMDSTIAVAAIQGNIDFYPQEPVYLSQLNLPLHLIVSDYTPTQQDSLAKYCKSGYSIKTIHGTGHYPMIEKPDEFNTLLDETLADIYNGH